MKTEYLENLSKDKLQTIIVRMSEILTGEQRKKLQSIIKEVTPDTSDTEKNQIQQRMSQGYVEEKMTEIKKWMHQIDKGELYLDIEEDEDYYDGYWDSELITNYYDYQNIGDKITSIIRFAKDCVDDKKYQEAHFLYDWLWEMSVMTDEELADPADLQTLIEEKIVLEDIKQIALLTLYTDYQVKIPENRAEDIYLYFKMDPFMNLHIEELFSVGRENLTGSDQFWKDWIDLLKIKNGDTECRLLKEAVLYTQGYPELAKIADEDYLVHPSLYLEVIEEYEKNHNYLQIEEMGERAVEKIDPDLVVRSEIALKAAYAASCLNHADKVMYFCWEGFRSNSTEENLLRLFGKKEMAEQYGVRGGEVLKDRLKNSAYGCIRNRELSKNIISDTSYYTLSFYAGDFETVKAASKNSQSSLGWSERYIGNGICLFLLYLYEESLPSKAAAAVANKVGFAEKTNAVNTMDFENEIAKECKKYKTSTFWNYFQRWKHYYPMSEEEKKKYLSWAEKIVYSRADAIVGGQHRRQYADVAVLLAMVAEIKEQMGQKGAAGLVFGEYKRKFPRHSSFQKEMKYYFSSMLKYMF